MARRWTFDEENEKRDELAAFYIDQNKAIKEVAAILGIAESSVFDRMQRLGIPSIREQKTSYNNKRRDVLIPEQFSDELAEFVGIMLGDGHLSPTQVVVTLNQVEKEYLMYVFNLIQGLFRITPKYHKREQKSVYNLYVGSVDLVRFFKKMGLVSNKVYSQVDIPEWILADRKYMRGFVRGFFDTDGSIYKLKFGTQMNFCNRSFPLLNSTRDILLELDYHPSKISNYKTYLTRKADLSKYANEIGFGNHKHFKRAVTFGIA
jgi:DNA-binding transcriptional regulator WhiA